MCPVNEGLVRDEREARILWRPAVRHRVSRREDVRTNHGGANDRIADDSGIDAVQPWRIRYPREGVPHRPQGNRWFGLTPPRQRPPVEALDLDPVDLACQSSGGQYHVD